MKRLVRFFALLCSLVLCFAVASAEETADAETARKEYETALSAAMQRWDELEQQYDAQLTEQQRFVARFKFTDAIQYAREGNYAMIDAISACDSVESFIALLNNGVIDPDNPGVPEDEILEAVDAILKSAGYEPEIIFVLHLSSDNTGDSWHVECGKMGLRTYENGDEMAEPFIERKLILEGEDHHLTLFADTELITDNLITVRF